MKSLEQQVIELQTKVAFQEDTLTILSDEIAQLNEQLDQHRVLLEYMASKLKDHSASHGGSETPEPPPPHY